ncbi:uncharacterized protein LOC109280590 [Alligator mississippiensis]|uniref:Uncharacterized protein n=1 Tax=Alligator mississippiensis TaxID=8496 RepID=A0A151MAN2_ALLMI|nr:uncharacterized protein LOC109280590 [Alligator mississippiensis]KYO21578.1 hypothetical protein Y1Q_0004525 [Alligator mississippiensis]
MFINHISIPVATWASAAAVTCEVRFNSSGSSVQRSAWFRKRSRRECRQEAMRYMVVGLLVLLMVSLTSLWMCGCSSPGSGSLCPATA